MLRSPDHRPSAGAQRPDVRCFRCSRLSLARAPLQEVKQLSLPTALAGIPPVRFLEMDTWTEAITISQRPVDTLQYFHVEVPEDVASVKVMVDQLEGEWGCPPGQARLSPPPAAGMPSSSPLPSRSLPAPSPSTASSSFSPSTLSRHVAPPLVAAPPAM